MNEEHAIFQAQQLDFIYSQSCLLYEIILNIPRSNFDPKCKPETDVDEIIFSRSAKPTDPVTNQMKNLSINHTTSGQATVLSHPTQTVDVQYEQSPN